MNTYHTSEVAAIIGVHPNTVRLYEELGLIPKAVRRPNGYRVFTDFHIEQFRLARTAFRTELLQGGLRKKIINAVKCSASKDFDKALALTQEYINDVEKERENAENAIQIARHLLSGTAGESHGMYKRKEVSALLDITMDTLRNWEMNGLLTVKRRENGYRVYTCEDMERLKLIRTLRCANYSLEAILRMLTHLSENPETDMKHALEASEDESDGIISVCDRLITSLSDAEKNAAEMTGLLEKMKRDFA